MAPAEDLRLHLYCLPDTPGTGRSRAQSRGYGRQRPQEKPLGRTGAMPQVSRRFEPRSLDSESRVLTVTPRDQVSENLSNIYAK